MLKAILADFNYRNLDEDPAFGGGNTSTEILAKVIFDRLVAAIRAGDLGPSGTGVTTIRVTLHESHVAWGCYEGTV